MTTALDRMHISRIPFRVYDWWARRLDWGTNKTLHGVSLSIIVCLAWSCSPTVANRPAILSVEIVDRNTVWVITDKLDLYRLAGNGSIQRSLEGKVVAVDFLDEWTGYVLDLSGTFSSTADGGATWAKTGTLPSEFLNSGKIEMAFSDVSTGWINCGWRLWRTEDGGKTWQEFRLHLDYQDETESDMAFPRHILIEDRDKFWSGSAIGVIFVTRNGGKTWTTTRLPKPDDNADRSTVLRPRADEVSTIAIDGHKQVWIVTRDSNRVFVSENEAIRWKEVKFQQIVGRFEVSSIDFSEDGVGWILGKSIPEEPDTASNGIILLKTEDSGITWHQANAAKFPFDPERLDFLDSSTGFLLGNNDIAVTEDNGRSWRVIYRAGT